MNTSREVTPDFDHVIRILEHGIAVLPGPLPETNPHIVEDYYQNQYFNYNQENESVFIEELKDFIMDWRLHYSPNHRRVIACQELYFFRLHHWERKNVIMRMMITFRIEQVERVQKELVNLINYNDNGNQLNPDSNTLLPHKVIKNNEVVNLKMKGFLVQIRTDILPDYIKVPMLGARICSSFCYVGHYCTRGKRCPTYM